uniref:AlNc14C539G12098 protein n=1 Tax=Albugo laibachii Nc14 TaxID=890382 RepID=F0X111_9STRA|nr:AlNc14C539G12098 [Albugo laibachii Nc14]|eukprot:CCA27458.1 AlNc14C539G12098 [Albugo laibachii Nc14]
MNGIVVINVRDIEGAEAVAQIELVVVPVDESPFLEKRAVFTVALQGYDKIDRIEATSLVFGIKDAVLATILNGINLICISRSNRQPSAGIAVNTSFLMITDEHELFYTDSLIDHGATLLYDEPLSLSSSYSAESAYNKPNKQQEIILQSCE